MTEKTLSSKIIYEGKILTLRKDEIETGKGIKESREVVSHSGGAAILVVKDGKVLLEKQYRYPYGEVIWEIPAGKRDKGEDFAETARRELAEETGYRAKKLTKLCEIYPTPGYTDEVIAIFKADGLEDGETHFDEGEDIETDWVCMDKARKMIKEGKIKDSKTVVALLWQEND